MKHALFYNPFSPKKNYNFIYLISGDHGRESPLHIVFYGNNAVCRDCIHVLNYNFTLFILIQKKKIVPYYDSKSTPTNPWIQSFGHLKLVRVLVFLHSINTFSIIKHWWTVGSPDQVFKTWNDRKSGSVSCIRI